MIGDACTFQPIGIDIGGQEIIVTVAVVDPVAGQK